MSNSTGIRRQPRSKLTVVNPRAAGIDIGSRFHVVAIPCELEGQSTRQFGTFTGDLLELATWLKGHGIMTVAMESTGVYWIPAFEILVKSGIAVDLVNARHVKKCSGSQVGYQRCAVAPAAPLLWFIAGQHSSRGFTCAFKIVHAHKRKPSQRKSPLFTVNPEVAHADESAASSCCQRCHGRNWTSDHNFYSCWRKRSPRLGLASRCTLQADPADDRQSAGRKLRGRSSFRAGECLFSL